LLLFQVVCWLFFSLFLSDLQCLFVACFSMLERGITVLLSITSLLSWVPMKVLKAYGVGEGGM